MTTGSTATAAHQEDSNVAVGRGVERRGSGFLLLAAEAMQAAERTQMRANAIRQVAVELAAASSTNRIRPHDSVLPPTMQPMNSSFLLHQQQPNQEQYMEAAIMQHMQQTQQAQAAAGRSLQSSKKKSKQKQKRKQPANDHPPLPPAPLIPPQASSRQAEPALIGGKSPPKQKQKHVYHDYSGIADSENYTRKKTGGVSTPFPEKLMDMLDKESLIHPEIVTWCSHGRAFIMHKPKIFAAEIMGVYFKQSKLTSFQRQLNLYGFRRITQGVDAGAYYHELFLRGRHQLCMRMQRQKVKGVGHKQPTDVSTEPNFYAMKPLPTASATTNRGSNSMVMEEVAVSVGDGSNVPLFLLGKNTTQVTQPFAIPDGSLQGKKTTGKTPSSISLIEASPYTNEAASMLRRLSTSQVTAPPPLTSAKAPKDDKKEEDTKMTSV